ncbi:MAG TPA: YkvA family protein [Bauldia sp.]|nr:YkvA family protein [Bauldia sp.]
MPEVLYGEILGPDVPPRPEEEAARTAGVKRGFWATFRKAARYIPFADELVAAYYCALDPATPHSVRAILIGALAYFVLPFDAVPDFLAGIGYTDDVTVLLGAIAMVRSHITAAHREAARRALDENRS